MVRIIVLFVSNDNPMASALSDHIGMKGNFACRVCHYGGPEMTKAKEDQIPNMFKVSRSCFQLPLLRNHQY